MKSSIPKVVVKPHYIGTEQQSNIFRRIFTEEIQRKIKLHEKTAIKKTT